ncbi:MAG: NAD+ synthase [bacterium]
MRIVIGQINPIVGDIEGNTQKILDVVEMWLGQNPDLYVFPEMCLTGYPPGDLLERSWVRQGIRQALNALKDITGNLNAGIIVGAPLSAQGGESLFNSAVLLYGGSILYQQDKRLLPDYHVFDEQRYFAPGTFSDLIEFKGEKLGLSIGEDTWNDLALWRRKTLLNDPIDELARRGATLLITISAIPYHIGWEKTRRQLLQKHAQTYSVPILSVNQVGGNDTVIFDGRSMFIAATTGEILVEQPAFRTASALVDTVSPQVQHESLSDENPAKNMHDALVLGIRDYFGKCGFKKALLGLSGGIDSAVAAVLTVEALGAGNVTGVTMPGPFSSKGSVTDSIELAQNLNIPCHIIDIVDLYNDFLKTLEPYFKNTPFGVAEENIQARIRGNLLMALSNKTGAIVLTAGNKSELAVGYCTLYGDMSGGLGVLSDVPKTWVYKLAEYINRDKEVIPASSITKPPSAELRADQRDLDTLPPYDILDAIIAHYIDEGLSIDEIVKRGFDKKNVRWIVRTVDRNLFKRLQAAPGLMITSKPNGAGRRLPIAARGQPD